MFHGNSIFQKELDSLQVDVAFILKPHNVFYFAGYASVCSGVVASPHGAPVFCTLWLDAPEAKKLCTIPEVKGYRYPQENLTGKMIQIINKTGVLPKRIGVEKDFMLLRDYEMLFEAFPDADFVHITPLIDRLRAIKSDEEIQKIRKSAEIADKAMAAAIQAAQPGVTEIEVAAEAEYVMRKMGSEKPAFSTFVASGNRTLLAHPIASRRRIERGEPVVIDLGATWEGYASDICRTAFAGEPKGEQVEFLRLVVRAQEVAASILRDGVMSCEVFDAVHEVFEENNLGKFLPHDIGYGVGLRQSEFFPIIEKGSTTVLKENMVVALLQTTSFSKKLGGLRVEDIFKIGRTGCEKITRHIQPHV
ncbi:MAG: Xaa-Pro peptidase family protein [Deltaproteobacteria bacterium]|nr:Xaa-Pro peptidase family protein [Deltaproteobacteria bacterium]